MGYSQNGSIKNYTPDDTATRMYILSDLNLSMADIIDMAREKWPEWKWPDCSLSDLTITSEWIHTRCLTYDMYDHGDYDQYLIIDINPAVLGEGE